jgi:hypothetical protein
VDFKGGATTWAVGGVGSGRGAGHETQQREGLGACGCERGGGGGGSGLSGAVPTCRIGKDVWAMFCGHGPVALGQPERIVLFFIYSKKIQTDLN